MGAIPTRGDIRHLHRLRLQGASVAFDQFRDLLAEPPAKNDSPAQVNTGGVQSQPQPVQQLGIGFRPRGGA